MIEKVPIGAPQLIIYETNHLGESALALLTKNIRQGKRGRVTHQYTIPSESHYPFQWFWDSCLIATTYAELGQIDRAKAELDSLFAFQQKDGGMKHVIFWDKEKIKRSTNPLRAWIWVESQASFQKPDVSAEIQPPVLAQAVEAIFSKSQDLDWLKTILPKVTKYYDWLKKTRTIGNNPLLLIFSSLESGLDQSPAYDQVYKELNNIAENEELTPEQALRFSQDIALRNKLIYGWNPILLKYFGQFAVEDVLVNSTYSQGLSALSRMYESIGDIQSAEKCQQEANNVLNKLIEECWDEKKGLFFSRNIRSNKLLRVNTAISLMPLILQDLPDKYVQALVSHLTNQDEYWTSFPIPSVAINESTFQPSDNNHTSIPYRPIWRGPVFISINWFLVKGLRLHGLEEPAAHISIRSQTMVDSQFGEYFNPSTGEVCPNAAKDFSWTALTAIM